LLIIYKSGQLALDLKTRQDRIEEEELFELVQRTIAEQERYIENLRQIWEIMEQEVAKDRPQGDILSL
jgi:hypothetical protein